MDVVGIGTGMNENEIVTIIPGDDPDKMENPDNRRGLSRRSHRRRQSYRRDQIHRKTDKGTRETTADIFETFWQETRAVAQLRPTVIERRYRKNYQWENRTRRRP
jgi:hypothetical protein